MTETLPWLESAIRTHLAPILRDDGFSGSGRTFRRVVDEAVHVIHVQGFDYGGRFAINLAVHPLCLPDREGAPSDPKKITQERCEFRHRLTEADPGRCWDHDGTSQGMAAAVADAAAVYRQHGRAFFAGFTGPDSWLRTLEPAALANAPSPLAEFCFGSRIRLADVFARMRFAQAKPQEAAAFAKQALALGANSTFSGYGKLQEIAGHA